MKNIVKTFVLALMLTGFMAIVQISPAQAPPPPPTDKGTNSNKNPGGGGGAPIDGGLVTTLLMVAGFGGWKWYKSRKFNTA